MNKNVIKIIGINDAIEFSKQASEVEGDVIISKGKYAVDAKSIMGIISIDTSTGVIIEYPETATDFAEYVKKFEVV